MARLAVSPLAERLEDRTLLSSHDALAASIVSDNLVIAESGADSADSLTISTDGTDVIFSAAGGATLGDGGIANAMGGGTGTLRVPVSTFTGGVIINTLGGDDSLTIDFSGGASFTRTIRFNGGETNELNGDSMTLAGGGTFASATFDYNNVVGGDPLNGTVRVAGNSLITYSGTEPVASMITATDVTFNLPDSVNHTVFLEDDGTNGDAVSQIRSSTLAFETTTFTHPTGILTINDGDGDEAIQISADFDGGNGVNDFDGSLTINADAGMDSISQLATLTLDADRSVNFVADSVTSSAGITTAASGSISMTATTSVAVASGVALSTVNGGIALNGNSGGTETGDFIGIQLDNADLSTSGTGNISLIATGGNTAGDIGIDIRNTSTITSTATGAAAGTITLNGTGQTGGDDGVHITGADTRVGSVDGNISITGNSAVTDGVQVRVGAVVESTGMTVNAATVTLLGYGPQEGVEVAGANAVVQSVAGMIDIDGTNTDTAGNDNIGVHVLDGGQVRSTGSAPVDVKGTGGNGDATNDGVRVATANSAITTSGTGNITITGQGGSGSGQFNRGVRVQSGGVISSTGAGASAGTITVMGTGGVSGTFGNHGISVSQTDARITSQDGDIALTGNGGTGTQDQHIGVFLLEGGQVTSTGITANAASITVTGTGGTGTGTNFGVGIESDNAATVTHVSAAVGNVTVMGTGGLGGNENRGVNLIRNGALQIGSGAMSVTGLAGDGNSAGVRLSPINGGRLLQNGAGSITVTATAGGTQSDFLAGADSLIGDGTSVGLGTAASGNITINANTIELDGATLAANSTGTLTVQPRTASTTIGLGGGVGTLNLVQTEIDLLQAGFAAIQIGDATNGSGNVDVHDVTFLDTVTISGGTISDSIDSPNVTAPTVTMDGTIAPGESPGILDVSGNFAFADNSTFVVEIGGTSPGTSNNNHDQLAATGTVDFGVGVTLSPLQFNGFVPELGDEFVIISRAGGGVGFAGLAEGDQVAASFLTSGIAATITYAGGDGNDVVIVMEKSNAGSLANLDSVTFLENTVNESAQIVDGDVTFTDADSVTFGSGGNLTVTYTAAGLAEDTLSVHNEGINPGEIGFDGTTVTFGGTQIGTHDGTSTGAGGLDLKVNLNTSATPAAVEALVENLTYANSSNSPTANRTISITVDDGSGGITAAATAVITVTPEEECYTVTTTADVIDGADGILSLREAIILANTDGDNSNIKFGVSGTFTLAIAPGSEGATSGFDPTIGDLDVASDGNLTIDGTTIAGDVIIDGNNASRIFHVQPMDFTIKRLTLQNGAEIPPMTTGTTAGIGGAIRAAADVVIEDTEFINNRVDGAGGAINLSGADKSLTVRRSTFSGNSAFHHGGAINAERGVDVTIENSTFSGNIANSDNSAASPTATPGDGGAFATHLDNTMDVLIQSSTFTGNSGYSGGAIRWRIFNVNNINPDPLVRNSIIAGNTSAVGSDDIGEFFGNVPGEAPVGTATFSPDYDFNVVGDGTGVAGLTDGVDGNQVGTSGTPLDAMLQPLADNGGDTRTHAILIDSPAVDAGESFSLSFDQRGEARPSDHPAVVNGAGDGADVGAFEIPVFTYNITAVTCIELRYNSGSNLIEIYDPVGMVVLDSKSAASLAAVVINGTDSTDDKLQINFSDFPTSIPITFNGMLGPSNGGDGSDELIFFNNSNTTTTYDYSSGVVALDGQAVAYSGLEIISNRGTSTVQEFNFTAGDETVSLEDVGTPMPGAPRPNAVGQSTRLNITGVTLPTTEFVDPVATGTVSLNLGSGADTVQLTSPLASFAGSLAIDTGDATDGDLTNFNMTLNVGGALSVVDSATVTVGAAVSSTSMAANAVSISAGTVNLNDQISAVNSAVVIDATAGIVDGNGAAKNVVATSAVFRSADGVGTVADPIETQVSNIAGTSGSGVTGFHIENMGTLEITTIDGTSGIMTSGGGVSVVNDSSITVSQGVTETNGGDISLTTNETTTLGAGSTVVTAGGAITFVNDDIVINGTATVNSGSGTTTIEPTSIGQLVTLGTVANTLSVSDTEFDRITAGVVHVGSSAAGNVSVAENISPAAASTLHVETGGSVDDGAGNQTIMVASLAVEAMSAVTLEGANDVDFVAVSSANGSVTFTDFDGFIVGAVGNVTGVDGGAGAVTLAATTGGITVSDTTAANDINAGTTITITLSEDNQTLAISNGANVESVGGKHVYTADEMDIVGMITATGQDVALQPVSAGEAIDLGSAGMDAANDTLELSNAELNVITASVLRIGRNDGSASGAILISMPVSVVSPPAAATLHLVTGSSVTQNSAFSAMALGISAGGDVTLDAMTNDVDVVAIRTTSGNVTFEDGDGYAVGSVTSCDPSGGTETTNGVGTAAGDVSLMAGSGGVTVTNTAAANDVEATGTITVALAGDDAQFTISAGADSESTGGSHSYTADKVDLAGTISANGQIVTVTPSEAGESIDLGSATDMATDTLELSSTELTNVTASILRIGDGTTGAIDVSANVTSGAATLSLINNAGISGGGGIMATSLAIQSPGVVDLSAGISDVATLAANVTGAGNAFSFNENDALSIGAVDGVAGLTTNDGDAAVSTGGLLTVDDDVDTGAGDFIVMSVGAVQNAGDTITAAGLSLMGTGTFTLDNANDVGSIAANVTGDVTLNDVSTLIVGTVGTKIGITTNGGDVTLTTAQQLSIGDGAGQDINAGAGNVTLTVASGGATEGTGSTVTATELALSGTAAGDFDLAENNAVGILAADLSGTLDFFATTAVEVGTSNSIVGISTNSNDATVHSDGNLTLTQAINTTTAGTTLQSTNGGIIDNNAAATNVTASSLSVSATAGIGSGDSLETTVSTIAATNSTSGNIEITNSDAAPLAIDSPGMVIGISNSAIGGEVSVTNVGAINTNQDVTADGDIFIKAIESTPSATGDDLTVSATVTISSANGNIRLEAGDDVTLVAGSVVSAPNGTVAIKGDCDNNDTVGSTIVVNGTVTSGSGLTVSGDTDGDIITIGSLATGGAVLSGGNGDDTYNVNFPAGTTFGSAISLTDSGGTDTLNANGSSDAETLEVRTTAVLDMVTRSVPASDEVISYGSGIESLNLTGGNANDLFDVQPSMLVPIDINGNSPLPGDPGTPSGVPIGIGDELRFDPFGNPFNVIRKQTIQTANPGPGGPFFDVTFRNIETFGLSPLGTDPGQRYDFDFPTTTNTVFAPVTQAGYTSVRPDSLFAGGGGFGWSSPVSSTDAQNFGVNQGQEFPLKQDGATSVTTRTFSTDVTGNGFYSVNVVIGSYFYNLSDVFIRNADNGFTVVSGIDTTFGTFETQRFFIEVTDGSLDLEFGAGSGNSRWAVSAVEFVPANNLTIAGTGGTFEAEGVTVDTFTAVGADANTLVTVATDIGTITSADIDPTIEGIQLLADASGNVSVDVRRPIHEGEALISFEQFDGRRYGCILPQYTLPSVRRFDFNHGESATQAPVVSVANPEGYIGSVETDLLTPSTSYGWLTQPVSRRAFPVVTKGPLVDIRRDGHMGTGPLTFQTNVPDGTYVGLATLGSSRHTLDDIEVRVNGVVVGADLDILFGESAQVPFVVTVTNGQIQVTVSDVGGELLWMLQGLEIRNQVSDVTSLAFINAPGNVTANGTTVTPITINTPGLADGTTVTVSSTLGTITSEDTVTKITGTQLEVSGGQVTFDLRSPESAGIPTLTVHTLIGDAFGQTADAAYLNFLPPLLAAVTARDSDAELLMQGQADAILREAQAFWATVPLTTAERSAVDSASIVIADLDVTEALGLADVKNQTIWIDDNGAGLGWDVDGDSSVESNRYDLLTTVAHELGHLLGLPDLAPQQHQGRLMSGVLNPGETRMTTSARDAFFGSLSTLRSGAEPTPFE